MYADQTIQELKATLVRSCEKSRQSAHGLAAPVLRPDIASVVCWGSSARCGEYPWRQGSRCVESPRIEGYNSMDECRVN